MRTDFAKFAQVGDIVLGSTSACDHGELGASATGDVMIDTLATEVRRLSGSTMVNDWSALLDVLVAEPLGKRRW